MEIKKLSALLLCAGMMVTPLAHAASIVTPLKAVTINYIHNMKVINTGNRLIAASIVLHLGVGKNNTCTYTTTLRTGNYQITPNSNSVLGINGDALARAMGINYSCMDLILQTDKQTTHDAFWLYNNGITYTTTIPNYDEVYIN